MPGTAAYASTVMESATLDDFMALNDQLAALSAAGIPVSLDFGEGENTAARLERINAAIARHVSQGATLTQALAQDDPLLSPAYRCLMQGCLRGGGLPGALDNSTRLAKDYANAWQVLRSALFYPTIVCCFAYAGLVLFCLAFVPKLTEMFQSMRITPGPGMQLLQSLCNTLPYWVAVPPVGILLMRAWQAARAPDPSHRSWPKGVRWLPSLSKTVFLERCANFAESLATLLEHDMPFEESLRIASGAWNDPAITEELQTHVALVSQGRSPGDTSFSAPLPPFLSWALWDSDAAGKARALRTAASIYRLSVERRQAHLRTVAPLVFCVIIGGAVTLLYGMALFVPVVEMLRGLAS